MINIAIDGPGGAGKSTISREAAKALGFIYVDTGALYRAIALYMLQNGVGPENREQVKSALLHVEIELRFVNAEPHVFLNGEDVAHRIRTPEVSRAASFVSALSEVRDFLFQLQRDIAAKNNIIMDGRDIGTVVLPEASLKIFLTASAEDRARRRYQELREKGDDVSYETVLKDLEQRDYNDSHRAIAPLKPAPDAVLLDTTGNTREESIALIITTIKERLQHDLL